MVCLSDIRWHLFEDGCDFYVGRETVKMVLALRNKLCRTAANIPLFRTWADMTLAFSSKDPQQFLFMYGAGAQME